MSGLIADGDWPLLPAAQPTAATSEADRRRLLIDVLRKFKGSGEAAELLRRCQANEMPEFILNTLKAIYAIVTPLPEQPVEEGDAVNGEAE